MKNYSEEVASWTPEKRVAVIRDCLALARSRFSGDPIDAHVIEKWEERLSEELARCPRSAKLLEEEAIIAVNGGFCPTCQTTK